MADEEIKELGQRVQELRKSLGMTQEELGRRAGYRSGAAVSISRFENGQITPGPDRLSGIAEALGMNPKDLDSRSGEQSPQLDSFKERSKDRASRVDRTVKERARALTVANSEFKIAQERLKLNFLEKLSDAGARIEGSQRIDLPSTSGTSPSKAARRERGERTHTPNQDPNVLAASAEGAAIALMLSLLRGARGLPIGGLAIPVIAAVAEAAVSSVVSVRRHQQDRARQVDRAEAELAASQHNFAALVALLPRATELLEYIAVHGGHALERWELQIGSPTSNWSELSAEARARFHEFLEISGAAIDVYTIDFEELAKTSNRDDLARRTAAIDLLLVRSFEVARSRV